MSDMDLKIGNVSVVGVGLVGSAWSAFLASRGIPVRLFDPAADALRRGRMRAIEQFEFLRRHGLASAGVPESAEGLLQAASGLDEAAGEADLVIEAAPERYDVKTPLFEALDRAARPSCVLASSSSGLLMTEIQQRLRHPERALIAHPFNPVHLVPLVELVGGRRTDPGLLAQMKTFFDRLGKVAIIVRKEVPGHIANRLQAAVWREAIHLVLEGVGSVADVDQALTAGPGIRWALMGQHLIFHLGGGRGGTEYFLDHIGQKFTPLWEDMAHWTEIPAAAKPLLVEGVQDELRGRSLADAEPWRDAQLVALLKLLYAPFRKSCSTR